MRSKDELIYDLVFSDETIYKINLADYVDDIYNYDEFVESIKFIMKKSKVIIIKSSIKLDSKTAMWELKVKK